jgi:hypothetical protein
VTAIIIAQLKAINMDHVLINAPPHSLKDSNVSPIMKTTEKEGVGYVP